jgi:hypothetical protein
MNCVTLSNSINQSFSNRDTSTPRGTIADAQDYKRSPFSAFSLKTLNCGSHASGESTQNKFIYMTPVKDVHFPLIL